MCFASIRPSTTVALLEAAQAGKDARGNIRERDHPPGPRPEVHLRRRFATRMRAVIEGVRSVPSTPPVVTAAAKQKNQDNDQK